MLTSDFDYDLPLERIAQTPAEPRDNSRLMIIDRRMKKIEDRPTRHASQLAGVAGRHFFDIVNYLGAGDLLVWNNTKVFKARLRGQVLLDEEVAAVDSKPHLASPWKGEEANRKILNSSPVEIFLVRPMENKHVWKVLAKPGKKLRLGMKIRFAKDFEGEVMLKEPDGTLLMQFAEDDVVVRAKANKYGEVPTPPYIKARGRSPWTVDRSQPNGLQTTDYRLQLDQRYQTVYAKKEGSVAAPTAGFHFTPELIEKLVKKGVRFAEVTLHVGLGTFLPVKTERVEDHHLHSEQVELTAKNADIINQAKQEGRRVVAVGTTTVRTLEGIVQKFPISNFQYPILRPHTGDINLFITPGFKFQIVDALITNFHLPKSTLLMLVCAFIGDREFTLDCYKKAIEEKYRFYSFGDAMLIK